MSCVPTITQAIAIPYRFTFPGHLRFCTVTSNKKQVWIFPKGIVDPGETPEQTALKEAFEEAGLHGELDPESLGSFTKEKWGHTVEIHIYLMQVTEVDDFWQESYKRRRRWRSPKKTLLKLGKPSLVPYLEAAIERVESLTNKAVLQTASYSEVRNLI